MQNELKPKRNFFNFTLIGLAALVVLVIILSFFNLLGKTRNLGSDASGWLSEAGKKITK